MGFNLEIEDLDSFIDLVTELKEKVGVLNDISTDKLKAVLEEKEFPIKIPLDPEDGIKVLQSQILKKMFGKKMNEVAKEALVYVLETR